MRKLFGSLVALMVLTAGSMELATAPVSAYYSASVTRARLKAYHRRHPVHAYFARHPKVHAAAKGAAIGAAAGAVTGLVTGRGVMRGGLIGAGTGAGVGLIRTSTTLRRHPIMRDVATGSAVGAGLGMGLGHHGSGSLGKGALLGGAVGLGVGLWKHM